MECNAPSLGVLQGTIRWEKGRPLLHVQGILLHSYSRSGWVEKVVGKIIKPMRPSDVTHLQVCGHRNTPDMVG